MRYRLRDEGLGNRWFARRRRRWGRCRGGPRRRASAPAAMAAGFRRGEARLDVWLARELSGRWTGRPRTQELSDIVGRRRGPLTVSSTGREFGLDVERFRGLGRRPAQRFVDLRRPVLHGPNGRVLLGERPVGRLGARGRRPRRGRGLGISRPRRGRRCLVVVVGQAFAEATRRPVAPAFFGTVGPLSITVSIPPFRGASFGLRSFGRATLGWTSLGWTSLGQSSLGWTSLGQSSLGWTSLGQSSLGQSSLGRASLGQSSLGRAISVATRTFTIASRLVAVASRVVGVSARLAAPIAIAGAEVALVAQVFAIVLRLNVGDVQEAVAADGEVDEGGLDGRLQIDDLSLVDVPGVALVAGPLEVQLFEHAILNDGDAAFLRLEDVNQHFFLHAVGLS